ARVIASAVLPLVYSAMTATSRTCYAASMPRAKSIPEVLTLEEVADYLRVPKRAVERAVRRGDIPGRRIEDTWRFLRAAIDEWLRAHDTRMLWLEHARELSTA